MMKLSLAAVVCGLGLGACSRTSLGLHSTAHGGAGGDLSVTTSAGAGGGDSGGATSATTPIRATGGAGGATPVTATAVTTDGSAPDAGPDGRTDVAPDAAANNGCLIAIRTDVCCSDPFLISRYEMDEDPCVQPFYGAIYLPECVARQPSGCELVDCAFTPPLTRVVGRGPDGTCQYISECETASDCLRASDLRECCGCPYYYPRALVEADGCLQDPATMVEWERCPDSTCRESSCMPHSCPAMPPALCSSTTAQAAAGLKACTWQVP